MWPRVEQTHQLLTELPIYCHQVAAAAADERDAPGIFDQRIRTGQIQGAVMRVLAERPAWWMLASMVFVKLRKQWVVHRKYPFIWQQCLDLNIVINVEKEQRKNIV